MSWNTEDWKNLAASVGKIAPALGTLIGGPIGGAAGTAVSILTNSLGLPKDAKPSDIQKAIETNPEAYQKIKQAELDHDLELQKLVYQTIQAGYTHDAAIVESLNKADSSGHSTRPKIALMMAWMLAIPYCLIGCAIVYSIWNNPTGLKDLWPVLLAYLSIPLTLLRMYFGDLRKEKAIDKGQQVDFGLLGGMFGGKKA